MNDQSSNPETLYAFDTGFGTVYLDKDEEPGIPAVFAALGWHKNSKVYKTGVRRHEEIESRCAVQAAEFYICGGVAKGVGALDGEST